MGLRSYIPAPPLSDFVDQIWYYEGYSQPHSKERLLPDDIIELIFNLSEDQTRAYEDTGDPRIFRGSVLSGPHSRFFVIDTAEQIEVIGIQFKPGGAFSLFKMPGANCKMNTSGWTTCGVRRPRSCAIDCWSARRLMRSSISSSRRFSIRPPSH